MRYVPNKSEIVKKFGGEFGDEIGPHSVGGDFEYIRQVFDAVFFYHSRFVKEFLSSS